MNYFFTPIQIGRGAYESPDFPTAESQFGRLDTTPNAMAYYVGVGHAE